MKLLSDTIGLELRTVKTEGGVGSFYADVLATTGDREDSGVDTVIENQYGATDHDHLGKLIAYGAGLGVRRLIWISESFKPEHRSALKWLNDNSSNDIDFFGLTVQAVTIGDSLPAVQLRLLVEPDDWRRRGKAVTTNPRGEKYRGYWDQIIPKLRKLKHISRDRKPSTDSWITLPTGRSGPVYGLNFPQPHQVRVELYLDSTKEWNKYVFDQLVDQRDTISAAFDGKLSWERLDKRKASRIACYKNGGITDSDGELNDHQNWMLETLSSLKLAIQKPLDKAASAADKNVSTELLDEED